MAATDDKPAGPAVAAVFDSLADTYDQTGVAFFRPVAERLVALLAPQAGETALDIGCGRGAATLPLAAAVGPSGHVDAVDLSPAMVEATRNEAASLALDQVTVEVADAADLSAVLGTWPRYDLLASSLVLFFLEQPGGTLRRWVSLVAPGGRIGLTTFGDLDEPTTEIEKGFAPWLPRSLLDARTSGTQGPFASDAGMEELFGSAGITGVTTHVEPAVLEFDDAEAWRRFSMSTGERALWQHVPDTERERVFDRTAAILEATREDGGPCRLVWQMRYTLGRR
jgi:ubiquinone/menaquinone biosynthesis C-methylase UbiE